MSPLITILLTLGVDKELSDIAAPHAIPLVLGGDKGLGDIMSPRVTISLALDEACAGSRGGDKRLGDIVSPWRSLANNGLGLLRRPQPRPQDQKGQGRGGPSRVAWRPRPRAGPLPRERCARGGAGA